MRSMTGRCSLTRQTSAGCWVVYTRSRQAFGTRMTPKKILVISLVVVVIALALDYLQTVHNLFPSIRIRDVYKAFIQHFSIGEPDGF